MKEYEIIKLIGQSIINGVNTTEIIILLDAKLLENDFTFTNKGKIIFPHQGDASILNYIIEGLYNDKQDVILFLKQMFKGLTYNLSKDYAYMIFGLLRKPSNKSKIESKLYSMTYDELMYLL